MKESRQTELLNIHEFAHDNCSERRGSCKSCPRESTCKHQYDIFIDKVFSDDNNGSSPLNYIKDSYIATNSRRLKTVLLDEYTKLTGFSRDYARQVLHA